MQIFLAEVLEFPKARLTTDESRHCIKVLRHQPGDHINITEGKGSMYVARIVSIEKQETQLEIIESKEAFGEHGLKINLAVSPLRLKDRFEWMMEKAVELGVNHIFPLQCQRTDVYKAKFKVSRIETILLTALKQSKRSMLPSLHEIQTFDRWIKENHKGVKFIGWCESQDPIQSYSKQINEADEITLLIGPEGDFTEAEVKLASQAGFLPISLGENRLRTETAGIFGLGILKFLKAY
ncbi:MAG: 16S rRNA (uracil(1498)-N(3))-methyltransferase [Bacteroidia bacterium]|nr:16S rRNA (uracil(1498)-N(3))-methyltransferase [Bacteroidia bacterium]